MSTTLLSIALVIACLLALLAVLTSVTVAKIEQGFKPVGSFIDIDGVRIHYVDQGQGPAVVIVHGLNGQLRHFTISLLAHLRGQFRVILIDRPGAGHSAAFAGAAGSAGLRRQGDLVAQLIAALGLQQPLLVGHSLGGAVALSVALDHPAAIRGLALIAPLTQVETDVPPVFRALALRSAPARWLFSRMLLVPLALVYGKAAVAMVFAPDPVPADFGTAGGGLLSLRPATYLAACADLRGVEDDLPGMVARYGELRLPLAILYGRDDRILNWEKHGRGMGEQVRGMRLELIDGGHMLPVTHPSLVAAFIQSAAATTPIADRMQR